MSEGPPAALLAAPRILVIDDNQAIHDDFRKIFGASRGRAAPSAAERALLGGGDSADAPAYRVDFAHQGEEGLGLVRLAREQGQPYAMAFVDVRMPPGWDGVETTARIWQHDPDIQIVICTAFSDYSWSEILAQLGRSDRLVILKKPFDTIEVVQLASALTEKWRLARESRSILQDLERRVAERTRELVQSVDELRRSESVLKEADEKIRRLNRVYAVLSGINALIVRVRTREELFREACRVAIEAGGFRMAWIGLLDRGAGVIKPIASAGAVTNFFDSAPLAVLEDKPGGYGLTGRAMRAMIPMISHDVQSDPHRLMKKELAERGINSVAVIPLLVGGEAFGVLALYAAESGAFDQDEMRLLLELAGDIAFAIEHIEKADKLARMTRVNAMLSGINAAIVRISGRQELFEEACRIAVETGGLPFAWFGVVDEIDMRLRPVASAGSAEGFLEMIHDRLSLRDDSPAGHGIAARSVREGRVTVLHDVDVNPYPPYQARYAELGVKAVAALPLMVAGRTIGTFGLLATEAGFFDGAEMKLLGEVVANIAFALEHMEKGQKVQRLTRVYAVLSGINALIVRARDRDELFKEACRIAIKVGGFKLAWVACADRNAMRLELMASEGASADYLAQMPLSLSERDGKFGLAGRAVHEKSPVIVDDMEHDPRVLLHRQAGERGFHSLVMLPLVVSDAVVGVLALYAGEIGFFNADEMKLLVELAGDIAFALEHIEKEEKLERLTRVRGVLSGINALIVRTKDRAALFEGACRIAVDAGRFRTAWIGVVKAQRIEPVASAATHPQYLAFLKDQFWALGESPADSLVDRAVRKKKAIFSNDAQNDPRVRLKEEHVARGTGSIAILPLLVADEVVGVLALLTEEADFFDAEELTLLSELAGDIAFALENLGRQQKLEKLARIRAVSSQINAAIVRIHDPEGLLREICRIAVEHGEFELTWAALIDQEKRHIQPVAWTGFPDEVAHHPRWADLSNPLVTIAEVIRTRKVAVRNDISAGSPAGGLREDAMKRGYPSAACVPFVVDESVAAAMTLFAPEPGFFDAEELALLNEMAADVSFALQAMQARKKVEYLSYYDALTGLANRSLFLERLAQYKRAATGSGHKLALFLMDLERFKNLNDSLGRTAGDALLRQVAEWLTRRVGAAALMARVGADLFAVVLPEVRQDGNLTGLVEKAAAAFMEHPFRLGAAVFRVAVKVGVAISPDDGADADTLFRNAEAALKKAKARGDRYLFYDAKMTDTVAGKLTLENQLRLALDREEFVLHYQPKVSLASGKLTSAEALIRWNDPQSGLVPPGRFIPVLEETGLINDVGRWALRKAIEDYLHWRAAGPTAVRIAVNVSPMQLRNRGFVAEIQQAIGIGADAAAGLELEITESLIMEDVKHNIASLQAIRDMGVCIAIDDFGTGFSSLSYLARLPVHTLKIDRSFVVDMTLTPEGLALVSTIINLAHSLKLKVVAEGVETEEQSRLLRLLGCDEMQGYLFSKPVPREVFEARFLAGAVAVPV